MSGTRRAAHYPGLCILGVDRVETAVRRFGSRFLERLFTDGERRYCLAGPMRYQRLATRLAAKLAARNAMRIAGLSVPACRALEVERDDWGKPFVRMEQCRDRRSGAKALCALAVSISHAEKMAVASVILTRERAG